MEVHFTPEQEAKLAQLANTTGTDAVRLVKEAALRAAVHQGIMQADQGTFIEEAEMDARLKTLLRL